MIILLSYLFYLYLSISTSYCMNGQSSYLSAHHELLVLSNTRSANPRNGLGLYLSLSNQVSPGQMQNLSVASNISSISPRTLVQKNTLTKTFYETNIRHIKTALCDAARELQVLANNAKTDFAVSLYFHLKDSIDNASVNKISGPIIDFLYENLTKLEPYLFDKNGSLKTLNASDVSRINSIIDDCKASAINKIQTYGPQWCAYDALGDSQNLERLQNQGLSLLSRGIDVHFGSSSPELFGRFERALDEKDFRRAWNIVKDTDSKSRPFFESVYHRSFVENFNDKGIDRRFLNDPFAQDLIKRLPNSVFPSVHNIELKKRCIEKERIFDKCGIDIPTTEVDAFVYQLVDASQLSLAQKVEKVCNFVNADSPNAANQTFKQLCFPNGLPRIAKYNKEVSEAQFSDSFQTIAHVQDRILVAKLGLLDTTNPLMREYISRVIGYIQCACSDNPLANDFARIGHALGHAVLNDENNWCLNLPNLLQELQSEHFSYIKQEVVKYLGEHINKHDSYSAKVATMYERMIEGDHIAQSFLEQALMPHLSEKILAIDIDAMHGQTMLAGSGTHSEITVAQFDKLVKAHKDMQKNGVVYSEKSSFIDLKTRLFMQVKGEKYLEHHRYRGNQLEHAIHDNILENYHRGAHLKQGNGKSQIQEFVDVAKQSNMLADQSLQVRDYTNAIHLTAFASTAYDYIESFGNYLIHSGKQIIEGSAEGVVEGVKTVAYQVVHPIQTVQNMAQGLGKLVFLINRMNKRQPSMLPLLIDPINASKDCDKYFHEIGIDIEALENKLAQMTLKDVAKESVQFLTEGILAGEIFKFSGTVCRTIKSQAQLLAHDAPFIHVSDKMGLAAGEIEVRFAQEAEAAVLKNSQVATQSFIREVPGLECPPSCVNEYEKLKNALKIEEFTSIIDCTEHGLQRLIERGFEPNELISLLSKPDYVRIQTDGAMAFIQKTAFNRFNIIVLNEKTREVVTVLKNTTEKKIINLGKNYGWEL